MGNACNLLGQKFGRLTVIEKTDLKENNYCLWRCRCDCGGEILVSTKKLKRGTITACDCIPKITARCGSRSEDLTGKRFSRLTVISREENRDGRICWKCCCDCGNKTIVTSKNLKAGRVKSCGCLKNQKGYNLVDLSGQQFGRLTALHPTVHRDAKGSVYWSCRCDCGKEIEVTESGLVYGNYRSCGCLRRENWNQISSYLHRVDGTCIELLENHNPRRDNTSGFRGVYQIRNGRYRVSIGFKGSRFHIGIFSSIDEAVIARKEAEEQIYNRFLEIYYRWKQKADENEIWAEEHPLIFDVEKTTEGFSVISSL